MAVFVIADLHLSTADGTDKSMEVFGPRWAGYTDRLSRGWRAVVGENDTVVVAGDISWALTLPEALSDLRFLDGLPGRKILLRGNHDYWWSTAAKMGRFCREEGLGTLSFLHNNAHAADGMLLCGTRGWFFDAEGESRGLTEADHEKIVLREVGRLRLSLAAADEAARAGGLPRETERVVFFHFPVVWGAGVCAPLLDVLKEHGIGRCYFGHIHGATATSFETEGIRMTLVAADALGFLPLLVRPTDA
ncbi:MAG: metallophosphoesterase [Clostridia bacterium]|nr:metallophosphoesterase [Clostridia bacterium]